MIRRESKFQTKFGRWIRYRWPKDKNGHFELKVATGSSLPFAAVSDKQKMNLWIARNGFFHKYSDIDRLGTPFDCTAVGKAECYVVVQFEKPKQKEFYMCPIEVYFQMEQEALKSDKKSAKEEQFRDRCRLELLN